ncbi:hypothetical protein ASPBRDRAFT_43144 [Aspergillus brasiliensis CBS 101740]|uniref:Nucleoside phosphorylase domain-containing protein n=1 Tax=Aspergillus brasiliensis (strain CBS 101740 / IMI 381727 / IBT 21946) TaxID=767769 RepID=A0A1L9UJB5_ASPBC|nr:hypothetical protein ASPBRDRAFT_43144 [Aspergillus brasiliensis CBS 101740]
MSPTTTTRKNPPPLHTYKIAYITALPKEQTAVLATFDSIHHHQFPTPLTDKNTYTLGCISHHNIVLLCLPTMGTIAAASAVTSLLHTFPSIDFVILVGVGGGIPSNGVRLGDVVVSVPVSGGYGGVVAWDRGMLAEDGVVVVDQNKGGAGRRLKEGLGLGVRRVLDGLKHDGDSMVVRKGINGCLDDVEERFPRLVPRWTRCDGLKDPVLRRWRVCSYLWLVGWVVWKMIMASVVELLGLWGFEMVGSEFDGEMGKGKMNRARAREKKERNIRVHYGLIASGNFVVKDARARDALSNGFEDGILCVEMEAAGVMDQIPCIVVRGICDYADSGKNKDWQEYAAMVAAAYARVLLESLSPEDVDMVDDTGDIPGGSQELEESGTLVGLNLGIQL